MYEMKIHMIFPIGESESITGIGYLALSSPFIQIRECAKNGSSRNMVIPSSNISHVEVLREVDTKDKYRDTKFEDQTRAMMAGITVETLNDDCIDEDDLVSIN